MNILHTKFRTDLLGWFCLFAMAGSLAIAPSLVLSQESEAGSSQEQQTYFAKVDDIVISVEAYYYALRSEAKQKYYHGKIDQQRFDQLQQEVSTKLIDQALLLGEADRLEITVDRKKVENDLARFEKRYSKDPSWSEHGENLLNNLKNQLETKYRIEKLKQLTNDSIEITEKQVKAFYLDNLDLFKTPQKRRLSLILIKVPPNALSEKWDETERAMHKLRQRVLSGESFPSLAKSYSEDESAENGGDMGLQHRGTLHEDVEKVVDKMSVGDISEPIRLLIGYVVVKLEDVVPEKQNSFENSMQRAKNLLRRELEDKAQTDLINRLRAQATIQKNEEYLNLKLDQ